MARSISSPTPGMTSDVSRDTSRVPITSNVDRDQVYTWILELINPETREHALIELRLIHTRPHTSMRTSI